MAMKFIKRKSALKPITGSIVDTFNINDKTTNAPSLRLMIDLLYPVGRGFIDFTDTDYSNWLGLTWERELLGVTPIGYKDGDVDFGTVGKTGGEKTHTLTVDEMPSHTHIQNAHTHIQNAHTHTIIGRIGTTSSANQATFAMGSTSNATNYTHNLGSTTATNQNTTATNQNTGGGQAHNNLPPYQVVSYWKRVDPNAKTMISFSIYTREYQADNGMTWAEWCNSDYNTDGYSERSDGTIRREKMSYLAYNNIACKGTDLIIANGVYDNIESI